jgi:hypothetical protein
LVSDEDGDLLANTVLWKSVHNVVKEEGVERGRKYIEYEVVDDDDDEYALDALFRKLQFSRL